MFYQLSYPEPFEIHILYDGCHFTCEHRSNRDPGQHNVKHACSSVRYRANQITNWLIRYAVSPAARPPSRMYVYVAIYLELDSKYLI